MNQKSTRILTLTLLLVVFGVTQAFGQAIYDNIPNPMPGNLPSVGYAATQAEEFGDRLLFGGTARTLTTVVQGMSSWGCESGHWNTGNCVTTPGATFSHPITLNIYNVGLGNQVGSLIGTVTQTFAVPYRPSADNTNCTGAQRWQVVRRFVGDLLQRLRDHHHFQPDRFGNRGSQPGDLRD